MGFELSLFSLYEIYQAGQIEFVIFILSTIFYFLKKKITSSPHGSNLQVQVHQVSCNQPDL